MHLFIQSCIIKLWLLYFNKKINNYNTCLHLLLGRNEEQRRMLLGPYHILHFEGKNNSTIEPTKKQDPCEFLENKQHLQLKNTVLARVSRPGWLSWEVCKSGRGWLTRRGVALLYIPLFLRGGWLKANSVQRYGGWLTRGGGLHERVRYVHVCCLYIHTNSLL